MNFTPAETLLSTRIFSMRRADLRRKLAQMPQGTHAYQLTLNELRDTQALLNKMADHDLEQLDGAA